MATINVDFYQVEVPGGKIAFESLLRNASKPKDDGHANSKEVRGDPTLISRWYEHDGLCFGQLMRIRLDDLPSISDTDGTTRSLDEVLAENEGLSDSAAFIYDTGRKVLVIQRRQGADGHRLASYLEMFGKFEDPILLIYVLEPKAFARMQRMGLYRKLVIRVAVPPESKAEEGSGSLLASLLRTSRRAGAKWLEYEINVGTDRASKLKSNEVVDIARDVVRMESEKKGSVKKARVRGHDGNALDTIDLLADRLVYKETIPGGGVRSVDYDDRASVVRRAYEHYLEVMT